MRKQKAKGQKANTNKTNDDLAEAKSETATQSGAEHDDDAIQQSKPDIDGANDIQTFQDGKDKNAPDETERPQATPEASNDQSRARQPSLSLQSKLRSSSFRRQSVTHGGALSLGANGAKSPELPILSSEGDSVNSIYRKQAARLDELERENKRLAKDAQDFERKWKQTEEELEDLREASGDVAELKSRAQQTGAQYEELSKLVCDHWTRTSSLGYARADVDTETRERLPSAPKCAIAITVIQKTCVVAQSGKYNFQPIDFTPSTGGL